MIGFEARDYNTDVKAGLCNECAKGLRTDNLEEITRELYRDVYCVNCHTRLGGSSSKVIDNANEKLCILLNEMLEDVYPRLDLGPGEEPEETDMATGVTKVEHPEDSIEQVIIDDPDDKTMNTLSKLSERGNVRYTEKELEDGFRRVVVVCT